MNNILKLIIFDLKANFSKISSILSPLIFFLNIMMILPFAFKGEEKLLESIFPSFIVISLLFLSILSVRNHFQSELENGVIDNLRVHMPSYQIICAKFITILFSIFMPVIFIAPICLYFVTGKMEIGNFITIFLTSSCFISLSILSFLLTFKSDNNLLLDSIIIMPLSISIMIFATNSLSGGENNQILAGIFLLLAPFCCLLSALSIEE